MHGQQQAEGAQHGERPGADAEAQDGADGQQQHHRPGLLGRVGRDPAGQRREPGHGQRTQPVQEPLVQVAAQPDAGVQRGEQRVLHDDAGQREHQVGVRRAGDGATEHVGEQQQEHDRLDAEVDQLGGVVLDLDQGAPGQGEGLLDGLQRADPRGSPVVSSGAGSVMAVMPGSSRARGQPPASCCYRVGASSARSSGRSSARSLVRWPVRDRKTSSSVEPRKVSSAITTPASSSRRTSAGSSAGSAAGAVTVVPVTSAWRWPRRPGLAARARRGQAGQRGHLATTRAGRPGRPAARPASAPRRPP